MRRRFTSASALWKTRSSRNSLGWSTIAATVERMCAGDGKVALASKVSRRGAGSLRTNEPLYKGWLMLCRSPAGVNPPVGRNLRWGCDPDVASRRQRAGQVGLSDHHEVSPVRGGVSDYAAVEGGDRRSQLPGLAFGRSPQHRVEGVVGAALPNADKKAAQARDSEQMRVGSDGQRLGQRRGAPSSGQGKGSPRSVGALETRVGGAVAAGRR